VERSFNITTVTQKPKSHDLTTVVYSNLTTYELISRIEAYFINAQGTVRNITILEGPHNLHVLSTAWSLDSKGGGVSCLLYLATGKNLSDPFGYRITKLSSTG
jgi:hypothetical protein